jgi:hypothetical protein
MRMRYPVGSKYVLESRGLSVWRYIEFPNGRRVRLATRKAFSCGCRELQQIGIIPDQHAAPVNAPSITKQARASDLTGTSPRPAAVHSARTAGRRKALEMR